MVDDDKQTDVQSVVETIWKKRTIGEAVPASSWMRPVTHDDVQYLLTRYPFIELIQPDVDLDVPLTYTILEARSGWIIHDYGRAIATSPGPLLYKWGGDLLAGDLKPGEELNLESKKEDDEGETDREFKPEGTVINQAFDTVAEIVEMVKERGWDAAHMLEGTNFMGWAAWVAAEELGMGLTGFEPSVEEKKRRDRIKKLRGSEKMLGFSPAKPPTP